eukprot:CAMPEP_0172323532 /NCGR_PEP_ID=MMETSP1058-20130122/48974_1 /TAXON_ID=83371 /ORGANISM="Detonula confervacea, Strain CCMP 353" /LENGTH=266 /DNA_ID=CAMNT_0013039553 /DNA_START=35 /DNA_END=835 /DNA_ORIENTATION=-
MNKAPRGGSEKLSALLIELEEKRQLMREAGEREDYESAIEIKREVKELEDQLEYQRQQEQKQNQEADGVSDAHNDDTKNGNDKRQPRPRTTTRVSVSDRLQAACALAATAPSLSGATKSNQPSGEMRERDDASVEGAQITMVPSDGSGKIHKKRKSKKSVTKSPPKDVITPAASTSHHIDALQRLDKEYDHFLSMEKNIENYLHQMQQEEILLRLALEQSSTSLKEQREKENKRKAEEAMARLEEALMMDVDSDDSSSCVGESDMI